MTTHNLRIVLLDAFTTDQGDEKVWEDLSAYGDVIRYDRSKPDQVLERCAGAQVVVTNKVAFNDETIAALPDLQFIGVTATGYDIIDTEAAKKHQIAVTNVPAYSTHSVAQHCLGLLLELANGIGLHGAAVRNGDWANCQDFCFLRSRTKELHGAKMAIIGYGAIGKAFADASVGLGIEILPTQVPGRPDRADRLPLDKALPQADIISLHCPLTPATDGMVNAAFLNQCRDDLILLNTGRGALLNEAELATWLDTHPAARCGLDVLSVEPPPHALTLQSHPQALVTPHIAWATDEARARLRGVLVDNIQAWQQGVSLNRVA